MCNCFHKIYHPRMHTCQVIGDPALIMLLVLFKYIYSFRTLNPQRSWQARDSRMTIKENPMQEALKDLYY
jgi:hypothetical protein